MPDQEHATPAAAAGAATYPADAEATYEPEQESDEWIEDDDEEELPRRPRRRLFTPVPLALFGVLLTACGFIGGVLIEKGQSSSTTTGASSALASRFAALRGASSGTSTTSTSGAAGAAGGFTRPTAGTVAYLSGSTLYVTNSEGNTIKVTTNAGTSVTKTVAGTVKGIHPGETVTVTGSTGSDGAVGAESISLGSSASGLAGLFGSSRSSSSGSTGGSGASSLFGG
jgi:hypothetical protein